MIGYIVYQHTSVGRTPPLMLYTYPADASIFKLKCPRAGVLVLGDEATVFADRNAARRAIQRTIQYALGNLLHWFESESEYTIMLVKS